jgi:hypothetical protein
MEDGSCCGYCLKVIEEPVDTDNCDNVVCAECPSDFTHESDETCCGICTKTIIDEPLTGCEAVTCADCASDFTHKDDGSCCGICTKSFKEVEHSSDCSSI